MRKLRKGGAAIAGPNGLTVTTAVTKAGSTEAITDTLVFETTLSATEETADIYIVVFIFNSRNSMAVCFGISGEF